MSGRLGTPPAIGRISAGVLKNGCSRVQFSEDGDSEKNREKYEREWPRRPCNVDTVTGGDSQW